MANHLEFPDFIPIVLGKPDASKSPIFPYVLGRSDRQSSDQYPVVIGNPDRIFMSTDIFPLPDNPPIDTPRSISPYFTHVGYSVSTLRQMAHTQGLPPEEHIESVRAWLEYAVDKGVPQQPRSASKNSACELPLETLDKPQARAWLSGDEDPLAQVDERLAHKAAVALILQQVRPAQRQLLIERYGLATGSEAQTLQTLGQQHGFTGEEIRRRITTTIRGVRLQSRADWRGNPLFGLWEVLE